MSHHYHRALAASLCFAILLGQVASPALAASVCGDVNTNGAVTTADALAVLRKAVGQDLHLNCSDYQDRYGFPADLHTSSVAYSGNLLGVPVTIESAAVVTHLGLIPRVADGHGKMALYTDNAGKPDSLVVATPSTTLLLGSQEIAVAETPVTAGVYWIMAVYDTDQSIAADEGATIDDVIAYRSLPYGNEIPASFGPSDLYTGNRLNYWVKVKQ